MANKITPFLWFDNQAEEAAHYYVSAFQAAGSMDSKVHTVSRYGKEGAAVSGQKEGAVMTVAFDLDGQTFTALNGGPVFKFTEAISFVINCERQEEVDLFWNTLSQGGQPGQCGWLKDKFGVSWQVVPNALGRLMSDPDPEKASRVMDAMLKMTKLEISELERAYAGANA